MNKSRLAIIALILVTSLTNTSFGKTEVDLVADALPGSILISTDLDSFEATGPNARVEEASMVSATPNFRLGVGVDMEDIYLDATIGAGVILNSRFRSFFLSANAGISWEFSRNGSIGPHVGVMQYFEPSWFGDADVDFEDETGFMAGIHMTIGYDVAFYVSMDYISGESDVTPETRQNASEDSVDLSGLMLQFGVRGTF